MEMRGFLIASAVSAACVITPCAVAQGPNDRASEPQFET